MELVDVTAYSSEAYLFDSSNIPKLLVTGK
jgi:hypothetical protein